MVPKYVASVASHCFLSTVELDHLAQVLISRNKRSARDQNYGKVRRNTPCLVSFGMVIACEWKNAARAQAG